MVRILEHNFEQFSCIQKQKIYDEIFGWFVYMEVQYGVMALYWEAVQWPLALHSDPAPEGLLKYDLGRDVPLRLEK